MLFRSGAVPYYYPLVAEHDFLPYVKDIPEEVAKKAKYMVVSLPSNPVGDVYKRHVERRNHITVLRLAILIRQLIESVARNSHNVRRVVDVHLLFRKMCIRDRHICG